MNILLAINSSYIEQLKKLLKSIEKSNPDTIFNIFILYRELSTKDIQSIKECVNKKQFKINLIKISNKEIERFPVYEKRYPVEIYFRLFATKYLPKNIDKILYLDTDIIVINKLNSLYEIDFEDNYFIATTNIKKILHKFNEIRIGLGKNQAYVNTGVLLMNLSKLRTIDVEEEVINFVKEKGNKLMLPDQDILSVLYGDKVKLVDNLIYNLADRSLIKYNFLHFYKKRDIAWVRKNAVIIHYYGKNKPWNKNYKGCLNIFYNEI